ncbi:MAG: two-component regulator propeller domain-containing protein [Bacteroidota bacterium]
MSKKFLWILGIWGLCCVHVRAQIDYANISFGHLDRALSQNTGYCIVKDHVGFLWIGTQNGLNRYDGLQVKAYKHDARTSQSLPSNTIYNLFEDSDKNLWVVTQKGLACYNRELDYFIPFTHSPLDTNSLPPGALGASIFEDQDQRLWILADQLVSYDRETHQFQRYSLPVDTSLNDWERKNGLFIFQDSRANIWYSCYNSLYLFNPKEGVFTRILGREYLGQLNRKNLRMRAMVEDQEGVLWMAGLDAGLIRLDYRDGTSNIEAYSQNLSLEGHKVTNVFVDKENALWFSSENEGIFILAPDRKTHYFYKHDPASIESISSVSIQSIYQEPTGRIWLGTYSSGLDYVDVYTQKFKRFNYRSNANSISYNNISSFEERKDGHVWIGTDGGGLNLYDPQSKTFQVFQHDPQNPRSISSNAILDLAYDPEGQLWVAHWEGGISIKGKEGFTRVTTENSGLSSNNISTILHDAHHRHYIGTQGSGMIVYNSQSEQWKYFNSKTNPDFSLDLISDICQDQRGNIWIGGINGLIKLTYDIHQEEQFENFTYAGEPGALSDPTIEVIYESSKGHLWVGTKNGLNKLNSDGTSFTVFTEAQGLPDNFIEGILEDDEGQIWVSTLNGLSRIQLEEDQVINIRNYQLADGLQGKQFNRKAAFNSADGTLYFGGVSGFNQIDLAALQDNPHIPPIVLTDFKIFNQPIAPDAAGPIRKHITSTDTILLAHHQSVFSFEFSALNFTHPENNQYAYMLEGFDDNWYYIGNKHSATFTNIPHGTYTFKVKASNNDGIWNEEGKSITLLILPPWWKTPWAYSLYVLVAIGLLWVVRKITVLRFEFQQREKLLEKEREIDQLKLRFFTNISHEFKTPLTLILAPLENLIASSQLTSIQSQLTLIQRNAQRLQQLINQLLDLRTLDAGKYELKLEESDIVEFLEHIFEAFTYLAKQYQIAYTFHSELEFLRCNFDRDILDKVMYNILSNAFKYTPNGGNIEMHVEQMDASLHIKVIDTGVGIAPDKRDKIFEPFYRVEDHPIRKEGGTGIGLALSKELIQLHQGTISFRSMEDKGTAFVVGIPINLPTLYSTEAFTLPKSKKTNPFSLVLPEIPNGTLEKEEWGPQKPLLFIVEDNPDLRFFLHQELAKEFDVQSFENGVTALEPTIAHLPDLILSDVMMPDMDGITFCQQVKQSPHSSHIPIILLTAKSSQEGQLKGLEAGADDYMLKPFSLPILKAKIDTILRNRQVLWEKLKDHKLIAPKHLVKGQKDQVFLEKLTQTIEQYIGDTGLNYHLLCKSMGMSKTQLYKKLNALTGKSVHEFIKEVRLKRAAELLHRDEFSVSEIATRVGFKHLANFSSHFKAFYGQPPSQFNKN